MSTEENCAAILGEILPLMDHERSGAFIEIGCGTFAYYFELFARLGFRTLAVEPLPVPDLREACQRSHTPLEEVCVADTDGEKIMFIGTFQNNDNMNLSSLMDDWWGSSGRKVSAKSVTLTTLLARNGIERITGIKIDVEGAEAIILRQLRDISHQQLPLSVMFEYGGGDDRKSGAKGWSEKYLTSTMECIRILKAYGYTRTLVVDSIAGTTLTDLSKENILDPAKFFPLESNYGNIIAFHQTALMPDLHKYVRPSGSALAPSATRIEVVGRTAGGAPVISFKKS